MFILPSSLTQLQTLQLQYNEIESIGNLKSYIHWWDSYVFFSHQGFTLIYQTRLQTLRLDSNKLSSIRPEEIAKLTQLKMLDISECSIENLDVESLVWISASFIVSCLVSQFTLISNRISSISLSFETSAQSIPESEKSDRSRSIQQSTHQSQSIENSFIVTFSSIVEE